MTDSRVLLAHEWLAQTGGSENVFEEMSAVLPSSRRVCLWNDAPSRFDGVEETRLARTPLRNSKPLSLPLMHWAWSKVDLGGVDQIVSSSHALCHHLAARGADLGVPSYAYVYSPARYIWNPDLDGRGNGPLGKLGRSWFRRLDRATVHPGVRYAAISRFVAERMRRAWGVEADVIYPPVDVERMKTALVGDLEGALEAGEQKVLAGLPEQFVLGASRFVPYKRLEDAIRVGEGLDLPVVLAGSGPDEARLRALASQARVPVFFVGRVSDELLWALYRRAELFVFTAVEDFGIMPIEAVIAGTPVVANRIGGGAETVTFMGAGTTADPADWNDLRSAANRALNVEIAPAQEAATAYSSERFRVDFGRWVGPR